MLKPSLRRASALLLHLLLALALGAAPHRAIAAEADAAANATAQADPLAQAFIDPPAIARPLTWWHWMNGNVTREGITADLEAMQRVGLAGAQIFNIQMRLSDPNGEPLVDGPATFMTPAWHELVAYTLAEAKRLGLELSILNCEGWSQAGGPNITPDLAMQKVVWTERRITGGQRVTLDLPQPRAVNNYYNEIALLAFPTAPGDDVTAVPAITSSVTSAPLRFSDPGAPTVVLPLPMPDAPQWVRLEFDRDYTFSSLQIAINNMRDTGDPGTWIGSAFLDAATSEFLSKLDGPRQWELQVSTDGETFKPVAPIHTHGTSTLPEVTGRIFRIWMPVPPPVADDLPLIRNQNITITGITFGGPRIDRPEARTGQSIMAEARDFTRNDSAPSAPLPASTLITLTGKTEWDAPPGNWTLLRIGHTATGAIIGPAKVGGAEVDKLSRAAVTEHLENGMLGTVLKNAGPMLGTTLKHILCDSWEAGFENWTPLMREEFLKRRGYAIDPWLPALTGHVVASAEASERFLWDFRRTIADLAAENYYGTLREFAHRHGLIVYAEAAGHGLPGVVDQLQCKGQVDVPMGEFWVDRGDLDDNKEAASAAHIYGRQIAGSESFTAEPKVSSWMRDPYSLKAQGDLRFCMGINRMSFHRFIHQPWLDRTPGLTLGFYGSNLERTNTWWEPGKAWVEYLARCQALLQQGSFVADLCYYYGEDAPVGLLIRELEPPPPVGYDYDACNTEILLQMKCVDGLLTLPSGMRYRTLVLPPRERMTPTVLHAVRDLVQAGATIVGPRPLKSPSLTDYPQCDAEVATLAAELWGDCDGKAVTAHAFGGGRVLWGSPLAEAIGVPPDFSSTDANLKFIHRRDGETEIYFVSNQAEQPSVASCTFRVAGRAPELWYPDSGRRAQAARYTSSEGRTTLPLQLGPAGSVFVIFRGLAAADPVIAVKRGAEQIAVMPTRENGKLALTLEQPGTYVLTTASGRALQAQVPALPEPLAITGPWAITFPPKLGAPASATFDELISWPQSPEAGIRHFSGTATYTKEFTLPADALGEGRRYMLDLGKVKNLAEVTLNGTALGTLWKPPFEVDATAALKPGANRLEVKVTNLWPNRLIGDAALPVAEQITWTTHRPFAADAPLLESGLLGPVALRAAQRVELTP